MAGLRSRPGLAPAAAALAIIFDLIAARLLLFADGAQVYLLGHPIPWTCAFRSRTGLPCPTCGITRSLVLSLQGELSRAWGVAPVGPVVIFGLLGTAIALLALAFTRPRGANRLSWLRRLVLAYVGVAVIVWIGGWAISFASALHAR
jgi:hypothetical protein